MANIIYDARKIKLMEAVKELSDLVGNSDEWFNSFWSLVMENENIYEELLYYIDHHDLLCSYTIENYSIVDLFVWQMSNYDLLHDTGKNDASCCKEAMVLFATSNSLPATSLHIDVCVTNRRVEAFTWPTGAT